MAGAAHALLAAVEAVLPPQRPLPLHEPTFSARERAYVVDCVETGWVSSVGAYVDRFERELAEICGVKRAIAVVNGTAALHVCLLLSGVRPGDEVIAPSFTFVATANAIAYCGALPHFVDIDAERLALSPTALAARLDAVAERRGGSVVNRETGRPIRAVVVMHAFGHPADIDGLRDVCDVWGLPLVEDAAESLGSSQDGRPLGGDGLCAALSFNGNKVVTTGGGGAVLSNDVGLAARAKHLTTTARVADGWNFVHDEVGYNYRMPNLNAALGCAQLEALPGFLLAKRALARRYADAIDGLSGVGFIAEPAGCQSNYWLCAARFDDRGERDRFLALSNEAGLMTRPPWRPMHQLPMFETCAKGDLSQTVRAAETVVNLPSTPGLAGEVA